MPLSAFVPSISDDVAPDGEPGLNVTAWPLASTAVHCVVLGHTTSSSRVVSTLAVVAPDGEAGLNVTALPEVSTAVHWLVAGHETAVSDGLGLPPLSIGAAVAPPGAVGSNVTSSLLVVKKNGGTPVKVVFVAIAVHWWTEGHATSSLLKPPATVALLRTF